MFGLNFSSKEEAQNFKFHLDKRFEQEKKSREFSLSANILEFSPFGECIIFCICAWPTNSIFSF